MIGYEDAFTRAAEQGLADDHLLHVEIERPDGQTISPCVYSLCGASTECLSDAGG